MHIRWLSEAEHAYLLYCSPRGFREYEINDEFRDSDLKISDEQMEFSDVGMGVQTMCIRI